ncbi:MAG: DeoR/GlpR family DNA-binding transcription regulator [Planctomycetia bacterium]|jgi:DeoR family transcriptional regulator of aga operon
MSNATKKIDARMDRSSRLAHIRTLVAQRGTCLVGELASELGVSMMTIRRDLESLAEDGRVIRTHGGATLGERATFEFTFLDRVNTNREAKMAIAMAAVDLTRGCQTMMLDGSTTTLAIARQLRGMEGLTVVTTSLPAAAELQHEPGIDVLLPGGYVRPASPDLTGSLTESNLGLLNAEYAFLGADAIDASGRVFTNPPDNSTVVLKMAAAAKHVYVVADHTKLNKTTLRCFGQLSQWDGLITDDGCDREFVRQLEESNIRVIVARRP